MKQAGLFVAAAVLLFSCTSGPTETYSEKIVYLAGEDATNHSHAPTAVLLDSEVGGFFEWDEAHTLFLGELLDSRIFRSVVREPRSLVDYGITFALSDLRGDAMQVVLTVTSMRTGEVVFTGVSKGNHRNGHFGFANIGGTETTEEEARAVQRGLVDAIRAYRIRSDDIAGARVAVLAPVVDRSRLPGDDPDTREKFDVVVEDRFIGIVESQLAGIAGVTNVGAQLIDATTRELGLGSADAFSEETAARIGASTESDYVLMSSIGYHIDGYLLVEFRFVEVATGIVVRSASFNGDLWYEEILAFNIGTNVEQMFRHGESATHPQPLIAARNRNQSGSRSSSASGAREDESTNELGRSFELVAVQRGETVASGFGELGLTVDPLFPVLYAHYDTNPIGSATIANSGPEPMQDVTVSFFIEQYMDNPKPSPPLGRIEGGESASVPIYALFTSEILEITEGARLSARVTITYTRSGTIRSSEFVQSVEVINRNGITWDDDRKIAAFVTSRDPAVIGFARSASGVWQQMRRHGVAFSLGAAMAMHEAMDSHGISYVPDPVTAYVEYSSRPTAVDYLLFPRQTLEYHGGDCDDLSALYSALLESIGVETAFVTTPGHIFVAVSIGVAPDVVRRTYSAPDEFIFAEGKAWVPVEVTLRNQGFLAAWAAGAREWRESSAAGTADFHPTRSAWAAYQPVGLPGGGETPVISATGLADSLTMQLDTFVDREITPTLETLQSRQARSPLDPRWPNRIGTLYGRYGFRDEAVESFLNSLSVSEEYAPALVNLGNIELMDSNPEAALDFIERAASFAPDDADVILAIARVHHALENYGTVRQALERLRAVAPDLAHQFAHLNLRGEEATRAAGAMDDIIPWSDADGE